MWRPSLFFPVPADQAKTGGHLTLRELEFESLENSDPIDLTSNTMGKIISEESGPSM